MAEVSVEKRSSGEQNRQGSQLAENRRSESYPSPWRSGFEPLLNPFALMRRMTEDMDRMFWGSRYGAGENEGSAWWPALEVSERDGKLLVHADLPGMNKEDVKVELNQGTLTIQGERRREREGESSGIHRSERSYGVFRRSIPIPEGANADQIKAQFTNGVLEISVPLPENQRARRIAIEGESSERKQSGSESSAQRERKAG